MFENYYQTELSYLREMGRDFATKHPALAGMLAERGTDPDVERLLEGFAFVAARLRQRVDDAAPELVESLAELLVPHALRPTPAATIVEFRSNSRAQRGKVRVEGGTRLMSAPVRGTRCTFTTTHAVDVLPLRLVATRLDDSAATKPTLTLRFEAEPGTEAAIFSREGIRLHLHGEPATTTQLHLWLTRHLVSTTVQSKAGGPVELGARALRFSAFDVSQSLLPWPTFSPHGARVLLEYFALPSKLLTFEIGQLDRAAQVASGAFEIVLRFSRPPALPSRVSEDMFRLHCVPAVNLFEAGAEPVRANFDERATLLRVAGMEPRHMEVFSVQSVTGVARGADRSAYEPFHSFSHVRRSGENAGYYKLSRQASPVDDGVHTYLSLSRAPGVPLARDEETLSIELVCTNRSLASELQVGDISSPTSDLPSGLTVSNIVRLSPPLRAPIGSDLLWHFVAHISCSRRSLSDREVLQTLLSLYGSNRGSELVEARGNRAKIDAIRAVSVETITRVLGGVAARGSLYRVELDQAGFASEGDAHLFGTVLHRVLALDAQVNTFADLRVTMFPSALEWRFEAAPAS